MIVDFHSHILPRADHGSDSIETTQKQLQMIAEAGTEAVVATPHFYPDKDTPSAFLTRREMAARALLASGKPPFRIYLGAEVLVCPGLERMEHLERLTIAGTTVILLEMPFRKWDLDLLETVQEIRDSGLHPVFAHIDRYPPAEVHNLLRAGFDTQLNADSLSGLFGYLRNRKYLNSGSVVALGSDLHEAENGGYQHFIKAKKRLGARADAIFARTAALLEGATPLEELLCEPATV